MASKYRSKYEAAMGAVLEPAGFDYEPGSYPYMVYHKYTPDWTVMVRGDYQILVEGKGWFRAGDRQKYKAIRDSLLRIDGREEPNKELVFLLMHPTKKCQKGGQITMAQWCDKEDIKWFDTAEGVVNYAIDNK